MNPNEGIKYNSPRMLSFKALTSLGSRTTSSIFFCFLVSGFQQYASSQPVILCTDQCIFCCVLLEEKYCLDHWGVCAKGVKFLGLGIHEFKDIWSLVLVILED